MCLNAQTLTPVTFNIRHFYGRGVDVAADLDFGAHSYPQVPPNFRARVKGRAMPLHQDILEFAVELSRAGSTKSGQTFPVKRL